MRATWFIGKFELLLDCTKHPIYSPKTRTAQAAAKRYAQCQSLTIPEIG